MKFLDQFSLTSKAEQSMAKAQHYIGRGGTPHILSKWGNNWGGKKHILGRGDTAHTLLMGGTIGVGTPHNIERIKVGTLLAGWLAGWLSQ